MGPVGGSEGIFGPVFIFPTFIPVHFGQEKVSNVYF